MWIGIDPGASGGIALIQHSGFGAPIVQVWKMPKTFKDLAELFGALPHKEAAFAVVEKVWAFPGTMKRVQCSTCKQMANCSNCQTPLTARQAQGTKGTAGFMENFGAIQGILATLEIRHELIAPQSWERVMGVFATKTNQGRKLTQTEKKNIHKAKAQQLFPSVKVIHATADALLLADFARRLNQRRSGAA